MSEDPKLTSQTQGWRIELDRTWDVLGPFPIHAREQHFLSPSYPLHLSSPISTATQYPTSLTRTACALWSQATTSLPDNITQVTYPSLPWDQMRTAEGWTGYQHLNVLRGWLSVVPPSNIAGDSLDPLLHTELHSGAFFTVLPPPDSPERKLCVPEWYYGNIYNLERAPMQLVKLPVSPAKNKEGTRYEVIICAPYEIRVFNDPSEYGSTYPILKINFSASLQFPCSPVPSLEAGRVEHLIENVPLQHVPTCSMAPNVVDGTPFGDAIGIAVRCLDFGHQTKEYQGYWSVVRAHLDRGSANLPLSLSVALLDGVPLRIAPTQTRLIPLQLCISPLERISQEVEQLDIELTCVRAQHATQSTFVLRVALPLTHVPLWTEEKVVPIQASHFFAKSMPTAFIVKPPKEPFGDANPVVGQCDGPDTNRLRGNEPILATHGAGVDVLTNPEWAKAVPRQKYAWAVIPQGRTSLGLDWHGPSAADAFATVPALSHILSSSGAGRWAKWGFNASTRVVLVGHSNGAQGAWYLASRWPDRMCALVAACGYIKSQAYVPWSMSRFDHFVDPALHGLLDTSLTPDDNDLFLGHLVGKPIYAQNGGEDDAVPPWHTREQVGIVKTWNPNADVTYYEDPGKPHWYPEIVNNEHVLAFLDRIYSSSQAPSAGEGKDQSFTLTVSVPAESGSLNGWQIHALETPGLLGRLRVTTTSSENPTIQTTNVSVFSLRSDTLAATHGGDTNTVVLAIDGDNITVNLADKDEKMFVRDPSSTGPQLKSAWKLLPRVEPQEAIAYRYGAPRQRLQSILSTHAPLTLLVPSLQPSPELSAALRIAHTLQLFHALDSQIVSISEVEHGHAPAGIREGNLVVVGCAGTPLIQQWLEHAGGLWKYANGAWCLGSVRFERPSSAILFSQPHPYDAKSIALFLQWTDAPGLERALRLFPIRTGVLSPDWLVVDGRADTIGAAAVQGAGVYGWARSNDHAKGRWVWNERMSWLD